MIPSGREPFFGITPRGRAFIARVWAPGRERIDVQFESDGRRVALHPRGGGVFAGVLPGASAGDRYRIVVNGHDFFPDPASRWQPDGVHGPSAIVDPRAFAWQATNWQPPRPSELIIYELHVGTFSESGTFAGVIEHLDHLQQLGVTAIELMPVADFPGERNWGYDGAALFTPAHQYGTPDDLRRLVDAAHARGIAVLLDIVYNHLGPEGCYLPAVSTQVFSEKHHTPWGCGLNFDDRGSAGLRRFFLDNALHWLREYHFDGLRFDATHAIIDDSPQHFLAEAAATIREAMPHDVILIAEDCRNLATIARPVGQGGWGFDAIWADDFHHQVRRIIAGDDEGYFADFSADIRELADTLRQGWFYTGQPQRARGSARGTDTGGLRPASFVYCLQNHDQIGNRPCGERLHHVVHAAAYRAASALLLLAPETPLLFMGQEWGVSSPFQYFTAHDEELGRLVREGRIAEFREFSSFDPNNPQNWIADPQAEATWRDSRLAWSDLVGDAQRRHATVLALYRALIALRRNTLLLQRDSWDGIEVTTPDEDTIVITRSDGDIVIAIVTRLRGADSVTSCVGNDAVQLLTTEAPEFVADDVMPIDVDSDAGRIAFQRPGAIVLQWRAA